MVRCAPLGIIPVGMYPTGLETPANVRNRGRGVGVVPTVRNLIK